MISDEEAMAWASQRKKDSETVVLAHCPCCNNRLAIYVDQAARQEIVPGTNTPTRLTPSSTDYTSRNLE
jgi:hypothetical protein